MTMNHTISTAVLALALTVPLTVHAYPSACMRDDASSQVRLMHNKKCNIKCLAMAAPNAPHESAVFEDGMDKVARQITARCTTDKGTPGFTAMGATCFPRNDLNFDPVRYNARSL
jgi:hypothetical protein